MGDPRALHALHERLTTLLPAWIDTDPSELDLPAYLAATDDLPLPPAERLRRLAAFFDDDAVLPWPPLALHQLHERLYGLALRLDPQAALLWSSRSFSATRATDLVRLTESPEAAAPIATIALQSARHAVHLDPNLDFAWYCLGRALYDTDGPLEEARAAFTQAARLDPTDGWTRLYVAHCEHDLSRWDEALSSYEAALLLLPDLQPWRRRLYRQQRAWCLLQLGRRADALDAFSAVLGELEAQVHEDPEALLWEEIDLLEQAAAGALREALNDRVEALQEAGAWRE
jgi:tetratricopeptide (TPR) repeat protein